LRLFPKNKGGAHIHSTLFRGRPRSENWKVILGVGLAVGNSNDGAFTGPDSPLRNWFLPYCVAGIGLRIRVPTSWFFPLCFVGLKRGRVFGIFTKQVLNHLCLLC